MTYFLMLLNTLFIELAMNLPVGALPLVLQSEGAARDQITLAMGAGMLTSVIVSMPIGALVDKVGRITTMKLAIICAAVTSLALGAAPGAFAGGLLMGLRSVALVCFMTAQGAYISVLVPKERSVSAVATVGIMGNLAFATAPACAVWLWQHGIARAQFTWATAVLMLAGLFIFFLPAEHDMKVDHSERRRVLMRKQWLPAVIFSVAGALQAGVNTSLAVLAFTDRGIANGAILFSASAFTTFVFRYGAGRLVELWGPRRMAIPTALVQAAGCLLAANAHSMPMVLASGICFGLGWAAIVPVVLGLLFEESSHETRGAAMGAFHFAFGLGAASGSGIATLCTLFGDGYGSAISICALGPLMALIAIAGARRTVESAPVLAEIVGKTTQRLSK